MQRPAIEAAARQGWKRGLLMRGRAMVEVTQRLDTIVVPGHAGSLTLTPLQPPGPGHSIGTTMVSPGFSCLEDAIK